MKKRLIFLVLTLIISIPLSFSSDALFSKVDVPRVGVEKDSERVSSEGLTRYVSADGLVASVKDSEIKYYHSDRIQSNRLVTDSSGSVEKKFKSLSFGQEISNSGVKYAFATGKELDESELYYFGARYYDSDLGRFTSADPVPSEPAYQYVRNNPMNLVDPSGSLPVGALTEKWAQHTFPKDYGSLKDNLMHYRYAWSDYGLLDVSAHVNAKFARNTIDSVFNAYSEGINSGKMKTFQISMGGSGSESLRYSMQVKLDDSLLGEGISREDLLGIAFGMFTSLSYGFEDAQGEHVSNSGHRSSSYANEDMRSNYLSFFISANDFDSSEVLEKLGARPIDEIDSPIEKKLFSVFKGLFMSKSHEWPTNFPSWINDNMPEENYDNWKTIESDSIN